MDELLKINWIMNGPNDLEEILDFLPDECIKDSYIFSNIDETLKEQTQHTNSESDPEPDTKVQKEFIPGKVYIPKLLELSKSSLSKKQQFQCLTALRLQQSSGDLRSLSQEDQTALQIYALLKPTITEENAKYLNFVREEWETIKEESKKIRVAFQKYAYYVWKKKIKVALLYPRFYKDIQMIPLYSQENEQSVEMTQLQNVLELGTLAKFTSPSLKTKCVLESSTLPTSNLKTRYNYQMEPSEDPNVKKIVEQQLVDVVISFTGLKRLIDYSELNPPWDLPIIVKEHKMVTGNRTVVKNVVYVNKPLPKSNPSSKEFSEKCHKMLLRTNFCQFEAFKFSNADSENMVTTELENTIFKTNPIILRAERDKVDSPKVNSENSGEPSPKKQKLDTEEVTEHNIQETAASENVKPRKKKGKKKKKKVLHQEDVIENNSAPKIHRNVSYRIWKLKQHSEHSELMKNLIKDKEITVLVRSKLDGCEILDNGLLQPVTVVPKIEYQLQYGGSVNSKSELAAQWASLFFKPFSSLYRARINRLSSEVVMMENCNLAKINNEAKVLHDMKPSFGLNVLNAVFSELTKLTPGNYLLHHRLTHGPFIALLKETDTKSSDTYDLHLTYKGYNTFKCSHVHIPWNPIDPTLILEMHNLYRRMPGMFLPSANPVTKNKNAKKRNKHKARKAKKKCMSSAQESQT